jgi:hypothetical protein
MTEPFVWFIQGRRCVVPVISSVLSSYALRTNWAWMESGEQTACRMGMFRRITLLRTDGHTHNPQERRSVCITSDLFPLTHRCTLPPATLRPSYCKLLFVHPSNALSTPGFPWRLVQPAISQCCSLLTSPVNQLLQHAITGFCDVNHILV